MKSNINKFAAISKVEDNEDGTITVFGIASTESVDSQGEIVTKGAMEDSFPDYFLHGTGALRAMHQPIAAGFVSKASIDENGNTVIEATVVDPVEITKVKTGTYKGFSIGGKIILPEGYDAATKTITKMRLIEISLVDRPANPGAVISMWKGEDMSTKDDESEIQIEVTPEAMKSIDAIAELVNKGFDPARLVAFAQEEIAKAEAKDKEEEEKDPPATDEEEGEESDDNKKKKAKAKKDDEAKEDETEEEDKAKSDQPVEIKKGMYGVSRFAEILESLACLACSSQYESDWEGDESPIPEQLRGWLAAGATIFQAMATEEVNEMVAELNAQAGVSSDVMIMEAAAAVDNLAKAGARNSKNDHKLIQQIYDNAVSLGAVVPDSATKGQMSVDLKKFADVEEDLKKVTEERDGLAKRVKAFEDQPAPPKAVLRVIAKEKDLVEVKKSEPIDTTVKKADGTIDSEATALNVIKSIHQAGGKPLTR